MFNEAVVKSMIKFIQVVIRFMRQFMFVWELLNLNLSILSWDCKDKESYMP